MKFTKINIDTFEVTDYAVPFSTKDSILRIRKEKECKICGKEYSESEYFGIVAFVKKPNSIVCDECCQFIQGFESNSSTVLIKNYLESTITILTSLIDIDSDYEIGYHRLIDDIEQRLDML